ncbi:GntR family transcriptional regulator [Streptosporangium sp. KLBMP 9127]|nr:GntR family transcriptional regulator [Streptosporangium sp. KLBMP 9127]
MEPQNGRPLTGWRVYAQIADVLREQIASGHFPAGGALPSELALSGQFRVARTTVRRALAVLRDEGLIVTIRSKGHVVKGGIETLAYRHEVIADDLRAQIHRGELTAGAMLPSEASLRQRHSASRTTVRHALSALEREGLIVSEQGKGRFVCPATG